MPRHDYFCGRCGAILTDQYRSVEQGGTAHPPRCPNCFEMMTWKVPRPRMSLGTDGGTEDRHTFHKFTARDGRNQLVEIDSINKLRQVERESEQLARNGEGQRITFRAFSQDSSNRDVNTHGEPERPPELTAESKRKWGLRGNTQRVDAPADGSLPTYEYGPGVNDSNTSPLPE